MNQEYAGDYRGKQYAESSTNLVIGEKIHFDAAYLNGTTSSKKSGKGKQKKRRGHRRHRRHRKQRQ